MQNFSNGVVMMQNYSSKPHFDEFVMIINDVFMYYLIQNIFLTHERLLEMLSFVLFRVCIFCVCFAGCILIMVYILPTDLDVIKTEILNMHYGGRYSLQIV